MKNERKLFTTRDVGCIADGALGHNHVRAVLADIMDELNYPIMVDELRDAPPDDYSDEDDAIDILNTDHVDGVYIVMSEGNLLCVPEDGGEV